VDVSPAAKDPVPEIDTSKPHTARIHNYYLGGKDDFAAGREVAEKVLALILHFIPDDDSPREIIEALLDALPPGSYFAASHVTGEHDPTGWAAGDRAYRAAGVRGQIRDSSEFTRLAFTGLELVSPGVVLVSEWRPEDAGPRPTPAEVSCYGGVARKP
jgi:hypothetical protein